MNTRNAEIFTLASGKEYLFPDNYVMVYDHPKKECPTRFRLKRRCVYVTGWYNFMFCAAIEYRDGEIYIMEESLSVPRIQMDDHSCISGVEHISYEAQEIERFMVKMLKESTFVDYLREEKRKLKEGNKSPHPLSACYENMIDILLNRPEQVKLDDAFRRTIEGLTKQKN